jgi:hypothetical protein
MLRSNMRALHCDMRYLEVAGAVVARRCAESFRYRKRADSSGEPIFVIWDSALGISRRGWCRAVLCIVVAELEAGN